MIGYPSSSMVAIWILSLLARKLITSVSVTGFGIFGIACMTFNITNEKLAHINIRVRASTMKLK